MSLLWTAGGVVAVLAQTTQLVVDGVQLFPWGHYTHLAPPAGAVVALYLGVLLAVFALFERQAGRAEEEHVRRRAAEFRLAFAVGAGGLVDFVPSFGWPVPPLGFLPIAASLVLVARAVHRHPLIDVTPALDRKSVV